ncbi:Na+:H+ antiporter [Marchantia polymorpha subsp. ruderalis]|nr:hypothetical protein MARPO_0206s0002 [Marchantia polymorpha]PTQ27315.1 hypothetical protein MARPO_0206s0002 [Marchantia polymorpha]BBN12428.1 hypothetical protein Mp_5g19970 [Marchantia polymorpha subsp. ruderalis]BBN12429.1 hypothetical protein Mp_5g19970 [Marchantia polymorpha subsp. ruderalis]|eukprot:PTQ27313.1 hypothetical protein MARPO_0206s0002 [Marchantia polymorpha]
MTESEVPVPSPEGANDTHSEEPQVAILFIGVSLFLGVICRQVFKGTRVPYTVALLILGTGLGAMEYGTSRGLGTLGASIRMWSHINPDLILFVFLPALLFESSFAMELHQIKRCINQMLLLAAPGVLISTFCLALVHRYLFPYGWNWSTCLLLGGLLSATDPVAVVALLKELGASKKLSTIVEGESLMNDGTAIVVFKLFLQMVLGQHFTAGDIVQFFSQVALGAVALGLAFGLVTVLWIGRVFNDVIVEITLTLTASYLAFFVAEMEAHVSGVLTVMTVGMFFAAFARTAFTGESQQSMRHFWEMVSYIANTLIFILSGVVIAESILRSRDNVQGQDWGYLVLLYVALQLSRVVVVVILYPGLKYFGYGLDWKEASILIWSGLRGAVALSLSLSVAQVGQEESEDYTLITKRTEAQFVFFTGGVVFLTLIINGTTTQFLLKVLGMDHTPETKALVLEYVRHEMYSKALESFGELGEDEDLGPAEWSTVCKYVSCLQQHPDTRALTHPHDASVSGEESRNLILQDTRMRFLNGVQAAYWDMLDEGRITRTSATLLMQSVDECLDLVARHEPMNDWKGLQQHVHFPQYLKWSSQSMLPQRLLSFFTVVRLELGCYIAAAFLRAHRQARHQLREFIGESEVADAVIKESENEEVEARRFLEDVRLLFPQVLRVIKTKQVTYAVLTRLSAYVKTLEEAGLVEEKETNHLHDMIQVDLKILQRKPPPVKMQSAHEVLINQPFFGALPGHVQQVLLNAAKECMMFRESLLFREDSKADGVWLVANGSVKWTRTKSTGRQLLHPTFPHGSTLGLYECLTGRPRLCTIAADSVAHCFFIDSAKLMAVSASEPGLEDFFWQESALVVAKIVLPQQFEAITMQELRALIAEGSNLCTYIRGETIELEIGRIGILLEGFIKQEGKDDVIGAPAGLLTKTEVIPTSKGFSGSRTASIIPQSIFYHVEARSRVLFIDLHSCQSTPFTSLSPLIPKQSMGESAGLMRFGSKYQSSRKSSGGPSKSGDVHGDHSASYSAKAMELSLFGSQVTVSKKGWRGGYVRSFLNLHQPRSQSYPTVVKRAVGKQFSSAYALKSPARRNGTVPRKVHSHGNLVLEPPPQEWPKSLVRTRSGTSCESDGDEEHIVEIESPSKLFASNQTTW